MSFIVNDTPASSGGSVTAAAIVAALAAGADADSVLAALQYAHPVTLADDTGWSFAADTACTAAIDEADEEINLDVASGRAFARAGRAPPTTGFYDLRARIKAMSGDGSADDFVQMTHGEALGASQLIGMRVRDNDTCVVETEGGTSATPVTVTGVTNGQGWMREIVLGEALLGFAGIGVAGAEPTSWTYVGSAIRATGARIPWAWMIFQANRGGAGALAVTIDRIRYRQITL